MGSWLTKWYSINVAFDGKHVVLQFLIIIVLLI